MGVADRIGRERFEEIRRRAIRRRKRRRQQRTDGRAAVRKFRRYRDDPVRYAREVLGIEAWTSQAELLQAVADHDRVLCRSGHKCGKSLACVVLALWWVSTRARGYVVLTAPSFHQVKDILWRELREWYPKVRTALGGGELPKDPGTGLELEGGRRIIGLSTSKPENLAGISGSELLFVVDEGSGFPDDLYEVLKGNAAGGAKIVGISNPTRTVGWFFEGFRRGTYDLSPANDNGVPAHRWRLLHISSEDAARWNAENDNAIPGLATWSWVEEMREDEGPDYLESAVYLVRVLGAFPSQSTDAVVGYGLVRAAIQRWREDLEAEQRDPLVIGLDVARFGDDETMLQAVRGRFAYRARPVDPGDGNQVANAAVKYALELRREQRGEQVRINVDGKGVGASVVHALKVHPKVKEGRVRVCDIDVSSASDDDDHRNLRSQIWFGISSWLKDGGALPEDELLEAELVAPTYTFDVHGRKQVERKEVTRKTLRRSPDRADALGLAVYRGRGVEYGYEPALEEGDDDEDDEGWESLRAGGGGAL
ncbi:MAG: hypothetical protein ACOCUS_05200 [Polyangiales bacterium]